MYINFVNDRKSLGYSPIQDIKQENKSARIFVIISVTVIAINIYVKSQFYINEYENNFSIPTDIAIKVAPLYEKHYDKCTMQTKNECTIQLGGSGCCLRISPKARGPVKIMTFGELLEKMGGDSMHPRKTRNLVKRHQLRTKRVKTLASILRENEKLIHIQRENRKKIKEFYIEENSLNAIIDLVSDYPRTTIIINSIPEIPIKSSIQIRGERRQKKLVNRYSNLTRLKSRFSKEGRDFYD